MRGFLAALLIFWPSLAMAGIINVEFKFTPFIGDPAKADKVETVPGKAIIYMNNVPIAEQEVERKEVPVLFEDREIAPSVWLPVNSLGSALRKGKNKIRIEFQPTDPKAAYRAQLRWASVTDQTVKTEESTGRMRETNQTGEGVDDRKATGRLVLEREFVAEFARDLPWHHYPAVKTLSDGDRKALARLVKERVELFKPDFAAVYRLLEGKRNVNLAELRNSRCLNKGYAAGFRVSPQPSEQLDFVLTGNPEVVVQGRSGTLFLPADMSAFERMKEDEVQMCVIVVFSALFPPRLAAVRSPSGTWEIVY